MNLTKIKTVMLVLVLIAGILSGCAGGGNQTSSSQTPSSQPSSEQPSAPPVQSEPEPSQKHHVRVGVLRGPSGMGMAGLMEWDEEDLTDNDYTFELAGAPEDMTAKILSGEVDIAAVPTNLASVLYKRTDGDVSVIAVSTLGVLYILDSTGEINSIADLSGKTLNATGQGAAPEYVLQYLLDKNGLDNVEVVYRAEHSELASMMLAERADIAMLPQPFVTTVTNQNENINIAVDLTEEWEKLSSAQLAMGCLIVRNDFLKDNKEALDIFLGEYEESVTFANRDIDEAAGLMEKFDIIAAAVASKAIPSSNIVYIDGADMKTSVEAYLKILFDANPQSVGGQVPDEGFYYEK